MTTRAFARLTFTDAVKDAQVRYGTRAFCEGLEQREPPNDALTGDIAQFVRERDGFFIATASRDGWPHVQHRGGPKGFLKILDSRTLAFGDVDGNKQFITVGNLAENDRVCLMLIDYAMPRRLKIWGRASVVSGRPDLVAAVHYPGLPAEIRRVIVIDVLAWDINCARYVTRRFDEAQVEAAVDEVRSRLLWLLLEGRE
jgi:hypothetical protein